MTLRISPRVRFLAALPALLLGSCNYPVSEPTATAELGAIEAMVGATLEAEGRLTQAAATATDTEVPTPTAGEPPAATSTPAPTATSSATPTSTPQPSNTPVPTNTPQPTSTPRPTATQAPTATPTPTQCAKFSNPSLSAKPGADNQVGVTWGSSGGCEPISGRITAIYEKESVPYAVHDIKGNSGTLIDKPEVKCEGTFTIIYELVLVDATGLTIATKTQTEITWIC